MSIANYCESARIIVDGLPRDSATEKLEAMLESASGQVQRAGEIIRRLRDFIAHGGTAHRKESLPRLITEANALALVGTRERGIEVDIQLDPKASLVLADRVQIQQVLVNLVRNAIDAMIESSRRRLTVVTQRSGDMVQISVEDTGTGLGEHVAEKLFQPFITSKETGMGVGLSICRTIVEAHNGRIWFDTERELGTAFHFTLPSAEA